MSSLELAAYMRDLCQEHQSASWSCNWEHYLWDAMLAKGELYPNNVLADSAGDSLTEDELRKLRELCIQAGGWRSGDVHNQSDRKYLIAAVGDVVVDVNTYTVEVSAKTWMSLHHAWLRTEGGRHNRVWRDRIYRETFYTVDGIADLRDRLTQTIQRARAPHLLDPLWPVVLDWPHNHKASNMARDWLLSTVRQGVTFRSPGHAGSKEPEST